MNFYDPSALISPSNQEFMRSVADSRPFNDHLRTRESHLDNFMRCSAGRYDHFSNSEIGKFNDLRSLKHFSSADLYILNSNAWSKISQSLITRQNRRTQSSDLRSVYESVGKRKQDYSCETFKSQQSIQRRMSYLMPYVFQYLARQQSQERYYIELWT